MNSSGARKRKKTVIFAGAAVLLLILFLVVLFLIETVGTDNPPGESAAWHKKDDPIYLTIGDVDYVSYDSISAYVIAGTDAGGIDQGPGKNGSLADFIAVLLLDDTTKKFALYQIDRNTMLDIPVINAAGEYDDYYTQQITTAHWYGMDEEERNNNLVNAVSDLMGLMEMNGYFVLPMENIGTVNHALGGVEVTITEDMTAVDPAFQQGATVRLSDEQAERFLRARMNVGEGTNSERMNRHRQFIMSAYSGVRSALKENPDYINELYDSLMDQLETDEITNKDVSVIANKVLSYEDMGILQFSGTVEIADTIGEGIEHEEFYVDPASIADALRQVMNLEIDTSEGEDESWDEGEWSDADESYSAEAWSGEDESMEDYGPDDSSW